ncbi:MAG: TIGR01212 family radical SAM protein [Deltaproteobacteria bacterium]|nr:TIGR01212 family radical SAM protein [Deltaproteobacteria bacterium]MBI4224262.1 TIGR01212 family radical SAM protein [Deltaproteobacteria bacterium]
MVHAKPYRDLNGWLKERFGCKVFKVSLSAGTTCPNIDGTLATGGCTFCNDASYAPRTGPRREKPIREQLAEGIAYLRKRHKSPKFIAYFQSFTSTYGDREVLLDKFRAGLDHPDVVGLALSTRPDCLNAGWAKDLNDLGKVCWIEIGLQTANDATLKKINRAHTSRQFAEAVKMWKQNSAIPICAHVIVGLPGETKEEVLTTARFLADLPIDAVKIHNLHVVKGTQLAQEYLTGGYQPLTLEEYVDWTIGFLELTPPQYIIHRVNAHAPRHLTLAPDWSVNKLAVFNAVEKEMEQRDTRQGKNYYQVIC